MTDTSTNDDLTREQLMSRISELESQLGAVTRERDDLRADLLLLAKSIETVHETARIAYKDRDLMHQEGKRVLKEMERQSKPMGFFDFLSELFGRRPKQ